MNALFQAALEAQDFMTERAWRFCVIGGLAVVRWGEVRATQGVDMTLLTGFGTEEEYIQALLSRFSARISKAADFALESRTLLLSASNGVALDVALGGIPFEESVVGRASPFEFSPEVSLVTCSAEDLVVLKAFANRTRDWVDVQGILVRQGASLDWSYIEDELATLAPLKAEESILEKLCKLREEIAP